MKYRWKIKELDEVSDNWFLHTLIAERCSELNIYCPLYKRLKKAERYLDLCEEALRKAGAV